MNGPYRRTALDLLTFLHHVWQETCPFPILPSDSLKEHIDKLFTNIRCQLHRNLSNETLDGYVAGALHHFFFSLHQEIDAKPMEDPVKIFMICSHLRVDGGFAPPNKIATSCSQLKYLIKLLSLRHTLEVRAANPKPQPNATLK